MAQENLDLKRPIFTDSLCTRISSPDYDEILFVTKFLKAFEAGKFRPGTTYDAEWNPWMVENPTQKECWDLLCKYTAQDGQPSFLIFHSFLEFMDSAFRGLNSYDPLAPAIVANTDGLQSIRDVMCQLLIETSKDFALRAVPRGQQFGKVARKEDKSNAPAAGTTTTPATGAPAATPTPVAAATPARPTGLAGAAAALAAAVGRRAAPGSPVAAAPNTPPAAAAAAPPPPPPLVRVPSARYQNAVATANPLGPPQLIRALSDELANRFEKMTTWEDTEHPVVLWYYSQRGQEVDGLDILSLNPRFLERYIRNDMKAALTANGLDFVKDWRDMKSEQGAEIVRKVEGWNMHRFARKVEQPDPAYVVTIDNLLKMLSIQLRMKNHLPVVIMGETGCGKR